MRNHRHRHLHSSLRPPPSSSLPQTSSSRPLTSRLITVLTLLLLSIAALAFLLQWKGDGSQGMRRVSLINDIVHVMETSSVLSPKSQGSSDCSSLVRSGSPSFPYFRDWKFDYNSNLRPKICITTTTSNGLDQILPWLFFHKVVGVSAFFLFVEEKAASTNVSKVLESIPGVKLIYRTKELEEQQARSHIWNETWLEDFFYKPCNYELFVKQSLNMEMSIVMAREAGMEWILHLDTDELIHPAGASEYSLSQLLLDIPENVDMVIFPSYESIVERDDVKDPFTEVSMFKKNYDHIAEDTFFDMLKVSTHGNPSYFLTYENGKSVARIQENLRPDGAHRWHNYIKNPKRDRCHCKPTKEDLQRCIMLNFDRDAFIVASIATEEEMRNWYHQHVVWDDKDLVLKLLREGILTRIYSPMVILQGLRESGVFSSVIASAQATISKDKFLIGGSNSTRTVKTVGPKDR